VNGKITGMPYRNMLTRCEMKCSTYNLRLFAVLIISGINILGYIIREGYSF
jgi:hypothetical protein